MKSACVVCNVSLDVEMSIKNSSHYGKSRPNHQKNVGNTTNLNSSHITFNEEREDDDDDIFEIFCNYFNFPFQTNHRPQRRRELTSSQFFCDTCKIVVKQLRQCHRTLQYVQAQIVKIIATLTCKIIDTTTIKRVNSSSGSSVQFTCHDDLQNPDDNELLRIVERLRQSIYQKYSPHLIVPKCSKTSSSTRKSSKIGRKQGNKEETNVITHNQIVKEQVTINDNDDDLSVHHFDDHEDSPEEVHPPVHEIEDTVVITDVSYLDDDDEVDTPEDDQKKSDCDYNPSSPESPIYDDDDDDDDGGDADYDEGIKSAVKQKGGNKRKPRIVRKRKNNVKVQRTKKRKKSSDDDDNNKEVRGWSELNCRRCGSLRGGRRNLKLHINEAHKEYMEKILSCPFCKDSRLVPGQDSAKNENGDDIQSQQQPEELYAYRGFVVHINSAHLDKGKSLLRVIQVGVGKFLYFKRCLFEERDDKWFCVDCHTLIEGGQEQMIQHLEITHIHPPRFVCEVCGKAFPAKCQLMGHATSHSSDRPFICEICGFGAKTLHRLAHHKRNIHMEGRTFKCSQCPKAYKSRCLLHQHIISGAHEADGDKIFECPHCSKKFALINSRTRHIKNFHTAERQRTKNHPCPECNKLFFTRSEVTQHLIRCPILVGPRQRRTFPKIPDGNNQQTANNERNEDEVLMNTAMAEMQNE